MDPAYAETDMFHRVIAHGMWGAGLISAVLGTELPGPGAIYLGQSLRFSRPVGAATRLPRRSLSPPRSQNTILSRSLVPAPER
jgi:acyl dehydratase